MIFLLKIKVLQNGIYGMLLLPTLQLIWVSFEALSVVAYAFYTKSMVWSYKDIFQRNFTQLIFLLKIKVLQNGIYGMLLLPTLQLIWVSFEALSVVAYAFYTKSMV